MILGDDAGLFPRPRRGRGWPAGPGEGDGVRAMVQQASIGRARQLRRDATAAERKLWSHLRNRQLAGLKFRRQAPIGPSIVDFVCPEAKVVIEVDGGQHADSASDRQRDSGLRAKGYTVVRIWNNEVMANIEGVLAVVAGACGRRE